MATDRNCKKIKMRQRTGSGDQDQQEENPAESRCAHASIKSKQGVTGHTLMSWCDRDRPTLARPASSDQRGAQIDARVWVKPSATRACRWLPRCASPPPQWPRISRGVSWGMSTVCAWRAASCSALLPLSSAPPPLARCSCSRACSALSWLACSAFSLWASARCSCSTVKVRVRLQGSA